MTNHTEHATSAARAGSGVCVPSATERNRLEQAPGRADRAVSWLGWHLPELGGVGAPLAAAWTFSPWCGLVSALAGAGWALNAARQRRRDRGGHRRQLRDATPDHQGHVESGESAGQEQEASA